MAEPTKFRIQAGALVFEMQGTQAFVKSQVQKHRAQIDAVLREQARLIKSGDYAAAATPPRRRGRPPKQAAKGPRVTRRPGRQPVIIRESSLKLKPAQIAKLKKAVAAAAKGGRLGKDATVFSIAYFLCNQVFKRDSFTAGDVIVAYMQLGAGPHVPAPRSVDVVQMLRNLAAASIGKQWVERNADGTFSLTAKGRKVGASGQILRPRGRRPKAAAKKAAKRPGRKAGRKKPGPKPGRKKKAAAKKAKRAVGRPRKKVARKKAAKRGPGRPRKKVAGKKAAKRGPGRPRKNA